MSTVEKRSDEEILKLARTCLPKSAGAAQFASFEELLAQLDPEKNKSREELLATGQQCNETLKQYFKRIKFVVTAYYDKDEITTEAFIAAFYAGIHPSIKEKVLERLQLQISRMSGTLKTVLPLVEEAVSNFSNQGKGNWSRPRNFCFSCEVKRGPLDLDDIEECLDECYE